MKVKVTVHLKSGGSASTVVTCKSMKELRNTYMSNMNSPVIVHERSDNTSIQIIPTDNIACINFDKEENR